jgi:benzylsuccinate CoA-transferase BbsF subunit
VEILQREGVAAAPVYTIEERDADLHFRERNLFEEVNHPEYGKAIIYNTPWRFDKLQGEIFPTPSLGQHNDYVFKDLLGLSDIEINQLKEGKVIY